MPLADRTRVLRVFVTIDVEMWPRSMDLRHDDPQALFERDVLGRTAAGDFGIEYQMNVLDRHGLRGVFFVEALHADAIGAPFLRDTVQRIRRRGHDVQLHVHPEWLSATSHAPPSMVRCLWELSAERQSALIARGLDLLTQAGAADVCAFRAGSYGADHATLDALGWSGLRYDSSCNPSLPGTHCRIETPEPLLAPRRFGDVIEIPVSCFVERRGRLRHAQISACSTRELRRLMPQARARDWWSFVVVTHSFEFIRRDPRNGVARPDAIAAARFEGLCEHLAAHRDQYVTQTFADLDPADVPTDLRPEPISTTALETAWRLSEQLRRRWT